eukprot:Gb_31016 [translate_table: standard]
MLGRGDSRTANFNDVVPSLPAPDDGLSKIRSKFRKVGLDTTDLVALSGGHTIGRAHCTSFNNRLFNYNGTGSPDPTIDKSYLTTLQKRCPQGGNNRTLSPLDRDTPNTFDNKYFANLQGKKGLLRSDQELYSKSSATIKSLVDSFSSCQSTFFSNFKASMIKMGNIRPLTGSSGEIRLDCRKINS